MSEVSAQSPAPKVLPSLKSALLCSAPQAGAFFLVAPAVLLLFYFGGLDRRQLTEMSMGCVLSVLLVVNGTRIVDRLRPTRTERIVGLLAGATTGFAAGWSLLVNLAPWWMLVWSIGVLVLTLAPSLQTPVSRADG